LTLLLRRALHPAGVSRRFHGAHRRERQRNQGWEEKPPQLQTSSLTKMQVIIWFDETVNNNVGCGKWAAAQLHHHPKQFLPGIAFDSIVKTMWPLS
jgi:hypothetical protein